ncbi:MAG: hypothetical protein VB039_00455 [Oscillospiraceae bacterium]|nr:hypothetical protein [Oscillospiraceae bacterium]
MADFLEVLMLICFGVSWPLNIRKAWLARTSKSSSVLFYFFIWAGYLLGLWSKYERLRLGVATPLYVWFFYVLNLVIVSAGIAVYFRNLRLDRAAADEAA